MKHKAKPYRGFSGNLWPLAKLTLTDSHVTLRKSGTEVTKKYEDIKYVTVSWLGSIRFHLEDPKNPDDRFSFLSINTPMLLSTLTGKSIPVGGHVLRRLFVSQLLLSTLYFATIILVLYVIAPVFIPSLRDNSDNSFPTSLAVFYVVYAIIIPAINVRRYVTGGYVSPSSQTKSEDWFPWD